MPELKLRDEDIKQIKAKQQKALEKAAKACEYLYYLGAKKVYLFGSILSEEFRLHSDIDIAVSGLPDQYIYIYIIESKIEDILEGMSFDLIYMEHIPEYMRKSIKERGKQYVSNIS